MAMPDDESAQASVTRRTKHQDELNRLGRSWFEQAREASDREQAEVEAWQREHNKWSAFNRRPKFETEFD
jgi:hypothetical protein